MSAIKFSLTSSQDKDLNDLTKAGKFVEDEGKLIVSVFTMFHDFSPFFFVKQL